VLTIGTFDGLHLGHQALIRQLINSARQFQARTAVITFHPRPKTVLAPHLANSDYLTTAEERITLFSDLGLDVLVITPFTLDLAQTTARQFVEPVVRNLNVVRLCVGHDFALGKNREGNVNVLKDLGHDLGYDLVEVPPLLLQGGVVSSTQIRRQLLAGDVRSATVLLGRYPALSGRIVRGAQRGRTIGFPTANFLVPSEKLVPANGVYATFVRRPGDAHRLPSVTNIGIRPSFDGNVHTVETFIFDFDEDIYEQSFTLELVERLRPEVRFDSIKALVTQIKQDADQARTLLVKEAISTT
jgi:riboflavin kinase/FMN adenylyltransferase